MTCLTLAVAVVLAAFVCRARIVSLGVAFEPEIEAWALVAEAQALCRRPIRTEASGDASVALAVRSAAGVEALEIAREVASTVEDPALQAGVLEASEQIRRLCDGAVVPFSEAAGLPSRSTRSASSRERNDVIALHLERLNEAASRGVETNRERLGSSPEVLDDGPEADAEIRTARDPAPLEFREPGTNRKPERPSIVIGSGTREFHERVARWSRIFRREAGALRTSRRDLQVAIESYSLSGAGSACRVFGVALTRLDSEFQDGAPSRGLSLRIARMRGFYRRGVTECETGRPVAAFAYLSEGDREWATIVKTAARLHAPRPFRVRDSGRHPDRSRSRSLERKTP
jgi:hypothetical protein